MWVGDGATATLVGCSFFGNNVGSVILSVGNPGIEGATVVRMEQCTFTSNTAELLSTGDSVLYADEATLDIIQSSGGSNSTYTYRTAPLSAQPAERRGLTVTSAWFKSAREVSSSSTCLLHCEVTRMCLLQTSRTLCCCLCGLGGKAFWLRPGLLLLVLLYILE
jgi:hypothetical protein